MDIPARTRFQRYRGLRSMRTSPWDPYENLPRDYARIFQFEDFKRTEGGVKRRSEVEGYGVEVSLANNRRADPEAHGLVARHPSDYLLEERA
jgi:hypothetical protein